MPETPNMPAPELYDNRELSWLKFNLRVLEEAQDPATPLFERLRFVSIFCSNLDEFFMIRVGTLYDQLLIDPKWKDNKSNLTAGEQLDAVFKRVHELVPMKDEAYQKIMAEFTKRGVCQLDEKYLDPEEYRFLERHFENEIQPLLSPQVVDKQHPFPFLNNLSNYVVLQFAAKADKGEKVGERKASRTIGIVPIPRQFERMIFVPCECGLRFVLVEDLVRMFADRLYPKRQPIYRCVVRVTRNADIHAEEALYDQEIDYRAVMQDLIKKRKKLVPVRLEIRGEVNDPLCENLCDKLGLSRQQVFYTKAPLGFSFMSPLERRMPRDERSEIYFGRLEPQQSAEISEEVSMMRQVEERDLLLSFPFESIRPFVRLLEEAADDPNVVSIKITLYRVASESKILNALIRTAENGKDVMVLIELRARFDEENNIDWSERLERAGCTVIYGPTEYKVHSKLCLITRKVQNRIEYITQIGTGNYNENTCRLYTDLSLITSHPGIGADASVVFNNLATGSLVESSQYLWVAPHCFRTHLIEAIDTEIVFARQGKPARIMVKFNSLSDKVLIDKLIEASRAGVQIDMMIRGICCLRSGVPGHTENIRIRSIVGRFLEHTRIYQFGYGEREKLYIASADFMTRNTERRVEVAAPILDPALQQRISDMLEMMFADNVKTRVQMPDGEYQKVPLEENAARIESQIRFFEQAYDKAARKAEQKVQALRQKPGLVGWFRNLFKS